MSAPALQLCAHLRQIGPAPQAEIAQKRQKPWEVSQRDMRSRRAD
jgi:hypothetical protein